jgi:ABC-type multidrug transport system permease subunit
MAVDINEAKVARNEFGLWLGWTLATTLGMIIGYLPSAFLVQYLSLGLARVLVPLLAGLLIGIAQWLVLRAYINSCHDWILNHAGGWVVGFALGLFIAQFFANIPFGAVIGFIFFGVIVAVFQWPVLRREIPHLWVWILANIIGWTLGAFISQLAAGNIFQVTQTTLATSTIVTTGITGLVGGAITALALIWIVRQPEQAL